MLQIQRMTECQMSIHTQTVCVCGIERNGNTQQIITVETISKFDIIIVLHSIATATATNA